MSIGKNCSGNPVITNNDIYQCIFCHQGIMFSVPSTVVDVVSMKRLWLHEMLRVYYDRLVDESDRLWFFDNLRLVCKEYLDEDINKMFIHLSTEKNKTVKIMIN